MMTADRASHLHEVLPVTAPWIQTQLQRLLKQRGHAWLLQGPSGLGQLELGLAVSQAWLCDTPLSDGRACGQCDSCHAIRVKTHADLLVLMPEVHMLAHGWPLPEKAQAELEDKKRKPSKEIRVDALRQVLEFSQRTNARGRGKVVLIYPAERMNVVSANTLLKTLEEPAGDLKFVLISEAAQQLLPTIRSRCISHSMQWPDEAQALQWLQECGVPVSQAQHWLRMTGGRPVDALALSRAGRALSLWQAFPGALKKGEMGWIEGLSATESIVALQKVCHDVLAGLMGAPARFFEPASLDDLLYPKTPSARPELTAMLSWSKQLMLAASHAEHPFHAALMTDALVSEAKQALNSGKQAPRRH